MEGDMTANAMTASQPIGVFDSGVGGLTVARAIKDRLPNESLLYLGDQCRFGEDLGSQGIRTGPHSRSPFVYDSSAVGPGSTARQYHRVPVGRPIRAPRATVLD